MTELLRLDLVGEQSTRSARSEAAKVLRGRLTPETLDDVLIVLSELVANAVIHTGNAYMLSIRIVDARLLLEVHDSDNHVPRQADRSELGRGLGVVQTVADRWGIDRTTTGKCVWAELELTATNDPNAAATRIG